MNGRGFGWWGIALVAAWLATGAACLAQPAGLPAGDVGWSRTDEGCFVWNPQAHEDESVSWSGACVAMRASGKGLLVWRRGGHASGAYEGEMQFGRLNGAGVFRFANGDRYEGEFRDDQLNGRGVLTTAAGNEYRGEFENFRMSGRGVFRYKNGDRYEGEFRNDLPNGSGRASWANGTTYEGGFSDGLPDGQGTYKAATQTFTGVWKKGCFRQGNRSIAVMVDGDTCR